ncbi:MAG TPA: S53 family peptidase [Candidatus Dormibacteraeota bacterium]|nr:S53 family peptidase [Candidatus Dormibacteraeota bacterium]
MRIRPLFALAVLFLLSGCQSPQATPVRPAAQAPIPKPPPTLATAIQRAAHLGPADRTTTVFLSFGLIARNQDQLAALVGSGRTVSPAEYAARFGPDPLLVRQAVWEVNAAGLQATWQPPSSVIAADGPAPAAASLLGVDIESYRLPDGATFYATLEQPHLPPSLSAVTSNVSGLDDYRGPRGYAIRPGGLTPVDVLSYYDIKPLRDAGLDGTGQTIMLPEIDDLPNLNDLDKFAAKFGLPAFGPLLTLKRDPSWGTPEKPQGETVLDLEIAHSVAPNARLVVYFSAPDFGHGDRALDHLVTDHLGSIISESLGSCEPDTPSGARNVYASIQDRAIALGLSHFVASGDSGAYTCGLDQAPAGSFPSTLPTVTAVGGTSVFESQQGIYYKEYAWGSPIDQSGGGGGVSQFYATPAYQKNELQAASHGQRQVPDVAADADPSTGFHIIFGGQDGQAGGTSAATPLWAATVALINQDLKQKGLREVGFANPALYWMGENSAKLDPAPFHDVVAGNNLYFNAATGWDSATGWGSMDAAAMDAAWIRYLKGGGA